MKRKMLFLTFIVVLLFSYLFFVNLWRSNIGRYSSFSIETENEDLIICCNDYCVNREYEENEWLLGEITDESDARIKAELALSEVYGSKNMKEQRPFLAYYDEKSDVWLVVGQMPFPCRIILCVGGTAHIVLDGATGKVLAIWHDK